MYKQMWVIRYFEEAVEDSFKKGLIYGTTHLCIGQEATAVGAGAALQRNDKFTSTHRGHGHSIAFGADLGKMMAELFGKKTGYCKGKGGSMHIADVATGNLGANGIVGGSIPIAVGSALTAQMKKLDYVTVCFFGDGATNEGSFHEALNLAAIWQLPVVFICENNGYGMSSAIEDMTLIENLSERASSYGFPGVTIDGNNLLDVYDAVSSSVKRARSGDGPTLIEAKTYRYKGHSRSDQQLYRTQDEVDEWIKKDPINQFETSLILNNIATNSQLDELKKVAVDKVEAALQFALHSEEPHVKTVIEDVYA